MTSEINNDETVEVIRIVPLLIWIKNIEHHRNWKVLIRRVARGRISKSNDSLLATPTVAEHVLKQFQEMVSMGITRPTGSATYVCFRIACQIEGH